MKPRRHHAALSPLTDFGEVGGHRLQGSQERHLLLVDGVQAIACTPSEYRTAALLLRSPSIPVPLAQFPTRDRHALARQVSRLRRAMQPLGFSIRCLYTYGYLLDTSSEEREPSASN